MDNSHARIHNVRNDFQAGNWVAKWRKTHVMMMTMILSQIARLAKKERRCRVRICPRMKPRSMKITSATKTISKVNSHS